MEHALSHRHHDPKEPKALCRTATHDQTSDGLPALCRTDRSLLLGMEIDAVEATRRSSGSRAILRPHALLRRGSDPRCELLVCCGLDALILRNVDVQRHKERPPIG